MRSRTRSILNIIRTRHSTSDDEDEWELAKNKWCAENNHEILWDGVYNRNIEWDDKAKESDEDDNDDGE